MIQFTVVTATNCELTKRYEIDELGQVGSSAIAHMTEGHARVEQVDSLSQLAGFLPLLTPHQAITCGIPAKGSTALTTRAGADFRPDAVARTNEAFHFPYGAALYPIDVDVDGDEFPVVSAVLDALEASSPWLQHVYRIARPSSSSFVGERGLRGVHVYVAVTRGTDIPDLAKRMQIEQWASGRGFIKISNSGALLTRQLSDHAVYQPSRLMFEASPVLGPGVVRNVPPSEAFVERAPIVAVGHPVRYKREDGVLDVQELPKMRDIEARRFETAVRNAKNARRREAKRIAIDYQTQNAIAKGLDAKVGERYGLLATRALGEKKLPPSWSIYVKDVGVQAVAQIVAALPDSLGFQCADPFDTWRPDIGPKHCTKAEIVTMKDTAGIWSHKLQEFFAFSDDAAGDLASPLEQAAEKLCGVIEFPEALDKKAASELNVAHALSLLLREADIPIRYNLSTYRVEIEDLPQALTLKYALARVGCLRVGKGTLENAIGDIARGTPYDPWKDAVLALPVWDNVARLDMFFADLCATVNTPALEATSQAFLAAIVMRQLDPGAAAPVVPVLIGGQGIGKTRFVEQLARGLGAPKPPAVAFGDSIRMSMEACTSIIAELSEMSGMGKREAEEIKSWVSATDDVYRAPYERTADHHPRRFVLIGTANKHELNRDETGNRRFMPIYVERTIDPNWHVELHQLLAEAKARFCHPDAYTKLCRTVADTVRDHNAEDMKRGIGTLTNDLDDLLPPILRGHLRNPGETRVPSAVIRKALDLTPTGRQFSAQKVSQWLRTRNWRAGTDGNGMRYYAPPQDFIDNEENKPLLSVVSPFTTEKTA